MSALTGVKTRVVDTSRLWVKVVFILALLVVVGGQLAEDDQKRKKEEAKEKIKN